MNFKMVAWMLSAALAAGSASSWGEKSAPKEEPLSATHLMEMQVKNAKNEDLGTIADLLIDRKGRVSGVILREAGLLGMGEHRYLVPWKRLEIGTDHKMVRIDVAKDSLAREFAAFESDGADVQGERGGKLGNK